MSITNTLETRADLQKKVFMAARDQGISSVLFRNALGRHLGLNVTDSEALSFLTIKRIATPTELARHTGLTSGSTTAMLDRLEKQDLITRTPNPDDRRGTLVAINKSYQDQAGPLVAGVQKAHHQLLATYSEDELKIIADFLTKFTENVEKAIEELK